MTSKLKNHVVQTKTVTMTASASSQDEIQIPVYGDIRAVEVNITQSTTGTLTGATTIDKAIKSLTLKDKQGEQLLQAVRGEDLLFLERFRSKGNTRTIPTTSDTDASETFLIPINVEKDDQEAKIQLNVAAFSDMATSGATGGELTYSVIVWYETETVSVRTEKIQRLTKSVNSGVNTFGVDLPKQITVESIMFKIGTEANITNFDFTSDGNKEMDSVTLQQLIGWDRAVLNGGHVTGEFSIYNTPFFSTPATRFDVTASGSDTMEIFVISSKNPRSKQ